MFKNNNMKSRKMYTPDNEYDNDTDSNNEMYESSSEYDMDDPLLKQPDEIIYPGLVLKKEYILLKKIGHGNNATVWMVYYIPTKKYLAMKIQDDQCYNDGCREVVIIKKINTFCKENPHVNSYCVNMLDFFVFQENETTKFVCSVYELFAGSVQMLLNKGKHKYGLPIPVVKKITKQLLTALNVLHSQVKIIHTDIKPENILFRGVPDYHKKIMDLFEKSEFDKKYSQLYDSYLLERSKTNERKADNIDEKFNEELEILCLDSVKEIYFLNIEVNEDEEFDPDDSDFDEDDFIEGEDDVYSGSSDYDGSDDTPVFNERRQSIDDTIEHFDYNEIHDLEVECGYNFVDVLNNSKNSTDKTEVIDEKYITNCDTALTDFGNSYFYDKRTRNEIQDRRYRSPEVILDLNYGYACDIWSTMCVVFELLTGFVLFEPEVEPVNKDIQHLYLMETFLGEMPIGMKKASKRKHFLFDKKRNYHIKNVGEIKKYNIKDRLVNQFLYDEKEANDIYDFLLCGLQYNPSLRQNAKELLSHPWLANI